MLNACYLYKNKEKEVDKFHKYFGWHLFELNSTVDEETDDEMGSEELQLEIMYSNWSADPGVRKVVNYAKLYFR